MNQPIEDLIDINDVVRITKIPKGTIRRYILLKQIPFYKCIKAIRFRASEIEVWLKERRRGVVPQKTTAQPELEFPAGQEGAKVGN